MVKVLDTDGKSTTVESNELKSRWWSYSFTKEWKWKIKTIIEFKNITKVYGIGDAKPML